ncbi:hypothetical protein AUC60_13095 [Pseudomonas caspiana]|uniref:Uncharacterized protein n=1 Tax=Pseudomonas caspiana TaxID=1451454 RepID=A0A1Y3P194_9PSED|nr:hypothetical protein AUC60_13095 [Pseudomonas caspiana]
MVPAPLKDRFRLASSVLPCLLIQGRHAVQRVARAGFYLRIPEGANRLANKFAPTEEHSDFNGYFTTE